jgi:hypothetical protein
MAPDQNDSRTTLIGSLLEKLGPDVDWSGISLNGGNARAREILATLLYSASLLEAGGGTLIIRDARGERRATLRHPVFTHPGFEADDDTNLTLGGSPKCYRCASAGNAP